MKNGKRCVLKKDTIDALKYYNKSHNCRNDETIDDKYTQLLLVSFVSVDDLKRYKIDEEVFELIKGIFERRKIEIGWFQSAVQCIFQTLQISMMYAFVMTKIEWQS